MSGQGRAKQKKKKTAAAPAAAEAAAAPQPVEVTATAAATDAAAGTAPTTADAAPATAPVEAAPVAATAATTEGPAATSIRAYFEAWNRRDMATACEQFADECVYDDTQYAGAFSGKEALETHLYRVADALPRRARAISSCSPVCRASPRSAACSHASGCASLR